MEPSQRFDVGASDDPDWLAREVAARRLGAGPDDAVTTRRLLRFVRDPEPEVRKVAVESLGKLVPTERRIDALFDVLDDPEWEVRWAAVRSLGVAASRSPRVRAALERALGDSDPAVAGMARDTLSRLRIRARSREERR